MIKMNIADAAPFTNPEGTLHLYEAAGLQAEIHDEQISIARIDMQPGCADARHYHARSKEFYIILHGAGLLVLNDQPIALAAGDVVLVQPYEYHYVTTQEKAIQFLAVTLPAFTPEDTIYR